MENTLEHKPEPGSLQQVQGIIAELHATYPKARYELDFSTPLELFIATQLAAQCTDERVNAVTKDLFQKYGLSVPKTWDEMLQEAKTISSKESGVAGLGLTTKNGSVRTFQEFISFFFEVNNGENPFKYDESAKKWEMNTTPEKLATVLKLYSDRQRQRQPE